MPQSVKPAPPQQSSLTEMWGGKKKQQPGPQSEKSCMDICDDDANGIFYAMSILQISYPPGERSKRKKPTSVAGRLRISASLVLLFTIIRGRAYEYQETKNSGLR